MLTIRRPACPSPTRFLVVSIRQGGNIRRLVSQVTPGRPGATGMIKPAAILCLTLVGAVLYAPALAAQALPLSALLPRARVVIAHHPSATATFVPQRETVLSMVEQGLTNLLRQNSAREAWTSVISNRDIVGLKVFAAPGPTAGTRPAVVEAVVRSLLNAGIRPDHIVIWDKHGFDLRLAGYYELEDRYGIRVAGSADAGYDPQTAYEKPLLGRLIWGDLEFGQQLEGAGRRSHLSKLVTQELTKIICITPLLNHNLVGVSGQLFGLTLGSVDNTLRFENNVDRLTEVVPEIFAEHFYERYLFGIVDALIAQYQGEARQLLHYSAVLNELWFSRDPVALDVLAIDELERQRQNARLPGSKPSLELYQNAALLELGTSNTKQIDLTRLSRQNAP